MLLYPLYLIHVKETDEVFFSDHHNQDCGTVYKLALDHSSSRIMKLMLQVQGEQEKFISAHCDLRTYAQFVAHDPSTPNNNRAIKQAVFTVASLLVYDFRDYGVLTAGVEVDPVTLEVTHWLVIQGFTGESRVLLTKCQEKTP